jgi:hypothetical protein
VNGERRTVNRQYRIAEVGNMEGDYTTHEYDNVETLVQADKYAWGRVSRKKNVVDYEETLKAGCRY